MLYELREARTRCDRTKVQKVSWLQVDSRYYSSWTKYLSFFFVRYFSNLSLVLTISWCAMSCLLNALFTCCSILLKLLYGCPLLDVHPGTIHSVGCSLLGKGAFAAFRCLRQLRAFFFKFDGASGFKRVLRLASFCFFFRPAVGAGIVLLLPKFGSPNLCYE